MTDWQIITSEEEIKALEAEWRALHARIGERAFSSYGAFWVWWTEIGRREEAQPHVVIGRKKGRLVAVYPLLVVRKKGLRVLLQSGYNVFYSLVHLVEDPADFPELWKFIYQSPYYDVAEIDFVPLDTPLEKAVRALPGARAIMPDIFMDTVLKDMTGAEWYETLGKGLRKGLERGKKRMGQVGEVRLEVYREEVPKSVWDTMIGHKIGWCRKSGIESITYDAGNFLPALARDMAAHGSLFFFCLFCGATPVGFSLCFSVRKAISGFVIGYDPAFSAYSPGGIENAESIRWVADNGYEIFSLMTGEADYKVKFSNLFTPSKSFLFPRTWRGWVFFYPLLLRRNKKIQAMGDKIKKLFGKKKCST